MNWKPARQDVERVQPLRASEQPRKFLMPWEIDRWEKQSRIEAASRPDRPLNPKYEERQAQVRDLQQQILAGECTAAQIRFPAEDYHRLKEAISGGLPLCFPTRKDLEDFQNDLKELSWFSTIQYDIGVYLLGSSVHGFSMNPNKELRCWRPPSHKDPSDADLAVCSARGMMYHQKDNYNNTYDFIEKSNFYDKSAFGVKFRELAKKWSVRLNTKFSFKLQLNPESGPSLKSSGAFEIVDIGNHAPVGGFRH